MGPSHVQTQTHVFAHSHAQTNSGSLGPSLIQLHTHARRRTHQYNSDSDAEEEYDGYDYNDGTSGSEDHANDDYSGEEGDVVYGDDDGGADTAEEDSEDSYEVGPDTYFFCPECDNQQYQELCRKIINFDPQCKGYRLVEER